MITAAIYTIYMSNVSSNVVDMQARCVDKFLPVGWTFIQYKTKETHAQTLQRLSAISTAKITIFLDVDCIPLTKDAFKFLATTAEQGILSGCVQRANHKQNDNHLYVGPFCMAYDTEKYHEFGNPTFDETSRADIGEELTYRWQEHRQPIAFLWPTHVYSPVWNLKDDKKFGLGTTYDGMFYHSFCIRDERLHNHFIQKCKTVLGEEESNGWSKPMGALVR